MFDFMFYLSSTVISCGNAAGERLRPTILYPGEHNKFNFSPAPEEVFPECKARRTTNGCVTAEAYCEWLTETFVPAVKDIPKPVVLFVDGHSTHFSEAIHFKCQDEGIVYYFLPLHASHIVQPLDLVYYRHLKKTWEEILHDHQSIYGSDVIHSSEFAIVFGEAWKEAYSPEKMRSSFRAAGLHPFNPEAVKFETCPKNYSGEHAPKKATLLNQYTPM